MKSLIAVVALTLTAGAAFAGEGNGNPFPFNSQGHVVSMQNYTRGVSVTQNPFPFTAGATTYVPDQVLPSEGSNGIVQTANSLPRGFDRGNPSLNYNAPTPTQLAQPNSTIPGYRG